MLDLLLTRFKVADLRSVTSPRDDRMATHIAAVWSQFPVSDEAIVIHIPQLSSHIFDLRMIGFTATFDPFSRP